MPEWGEGTEYETMSDYQAAVNKAMYGGGVSGGRTTTQKPVQTAKLGDLIARMLLKISQDTSGAYTAKQQLAAQTAFFESGIRTLDVTPKAAWDKIKHPGVSDYYWSEMKNMVASGRTDPVQGAKSMLGLQAEWARRAEVSPYMTYPSGGVAAGKAHIAPYLEAGGWVSSYEYIKNNPEYAKAMYEQQPDFFYRVLNSLVDPMGNIRYGGVDEETRVDWQGAVDVMLGAIKAKESWTQYLAILETLPKMRAREERTPIGAPWTQAFTETPMGTLPPWVQATEGMTEPRW